jgi:peptidoglycan/LPS O-acetylase OafA/YrhL
VVAFHAGLPLFGGGFVGVDVFFVISGYLITGILVDEARGGRIRLLDFWARRIRRLVPALAVVVVATLLLSLLVYSPLAWPHIAREARASSLYVSNLLFARDAASYFALPLDESPYLHTWSLGVEEQFYLAWPLIFFALAVVWRARRPTGRVAVVGVLVAVAGLSFALSIWLTQRAQPWAFFSSPTRAWEFALGGIAAVGLSRIPQQSRGSRIIGWLGLFAVLFAVVRFDDFTLYPGVAAVLPVLGAVAILAGSAGAGPGPARLLAWPPLMWLGGLSYTWYLWHWPLIVFVAAALPSSGVAMRSGAALVALLLAWMTTRFIETPIRFRSRFTRSRGLTYAGGLVATVVAITASAAIIRIADQRQATDPLLAELAAARADVAGVTTDGCTEKTGSVRGACVSGDPSGARTVMLLGDSHAAHWRPAIDQVAKALHLRVVMRTFGGCPATEAPVAREGTHEVRDGCAERRAETAQLLDELHPDAVIVSHTDYMGWILDDGGVPGSPNDQREQWNVALRDFAHDLGQRGIPLGLILDVPAMEHDPIECLAKGRSREECGVDQQALDELAQRSAGEQQALAAAGHGVAFDPVPLLCSDDVCPIRQDGILEYNDPDHLTRAFSRHLAPQIQPFIESLL